MPLYSCTAVGNCSAAGLRGSGGCCPACDKRYCEAHIDPCPSHQCPTYETDEAAVVAASTRALEAELASFAQRFNSTALATRASFLRSGVACFVPDMTLETLRGLSRGGMNIHVPVRFNDGVEWICRIRRENSAALPLSARDRVVMSEAATLRFLSENTRVPVPLVFDVVPPSTPGAVGVGYILMEKTAGHEMDWYALGEPAKRRVLSQFADIFASLHEHPFWSIGCLQAGVSGGQPKMGPLVQEYAIDTVKDPLGSYPCASSYLWHVTQAHIEHVIARECYRGSEAEDFYLAQKYVQNHVDLLAATSAKFFLKHMDDKGDHILLDDDFNITGIIDWEWAQTVPAEDAFSAPLFLLDVGAYYSGDDEMSADEKVFAEILEDKGHSELAKLVRTGRKMHRLAHIMDDSAAIEDLQMHFCSFRKLVVLEDEHVEKDGEDEWGTWKQSYKQQLGGDESLRKLSE